MDIKASTKYMIIYGYMPYPTPSKKYEYEGIYYIQDNAYKQINISGQTLYWCNTYKRLWLYKNVYFSRTFLWSISVSKIVYFQM